MLQRLMAIGIVAGFTGIVIGAYATLAFSEWLVSGIDDDYDPVLY